MTHSTKSSSPATSPIKTRRALLLAAILAIVFSMLASGTASAQGSERGISRGESKTLEMQQAPEQTTLAVSVAADTDAETVIFQASEDGDDYGVAAGPPSCQFDCIERAWLSSNLSSTAMTLEVETDINASIEYSVSADMPMLGADGLPHFPLALTTGSSPILTDYWITTIDGLDADTDYYIIVKATSNGGTHIESGAFRTVTPAATGIGDWDNMHDAGCSLECITSANLVSYPDEQDRIGFVVETLVPAVIYVSVSSEPLVWNDGVPGVSPLDGAAGQFEYETSFIGSIDGLDSATTYNVIVAATDEHGNTDYFVDEVQTHAMSFDLIYAPLRTIVHENGDKYFRGEVSFSWFIGNYPNILYSGSRPTAKIEDGESFYFGEGTFYPIQNVAEDEILPNFRMYGSDSDAFEFDTGGNDAQLWNWYWHNFVVEQRVADIDDQPLCGSLPEIPSDHPWADTHCFVIQTHPKHDQPHFTTILAIHKTPAGQGYG